MQPLIEYQGETLCYSIIINRRLKHLYIMIDPIKGVIVKTPYTSHEYVHNLVMQKAAWIFTKVKAAAKRMTVQSLFSEEGKVLYLGESILLNAKQTPEAFYTLSGRVEFFNERKANKNKLSQSQKALG